MTYEEKLRYQAIGAALSTWKRMRDDERYGFAGFSLRKSSPIATIVVGLRFDTLKEIVGASVPGQEEKLGYAIGKGALATGQILPEEVIVSPSGSGSSRSAWNMPA